MSATPQGTPRRYLLFAGESYYPIGGWDDFVGSFDTVEEARAEVARAEAELESYDWSHIVDLQTGKEVPK